MPQPTQFDDCDVGDNQWREGELGAYRQSPSDGSVRFLPDSIDPSVSRRLRSRNDGLPPNYHKLFSKNEMNFLAWGTQIRSIHA